MNIVSYSIFGESTRTPENSFEFYAYMRGIVFNTIMNSLLYPDWQTFINVDSKTYSSYDNIFRALQETYNVGIDVNVPEPLCKGMIRRLAPLFYNDTEYLICRDADALTTYRESKMVNEWIQSGLSVHCILDNPAHAGIMGGMCGFKGKSVREKIATWDDLVSNYDLERRGSDQNLLQQRIVPLFVNDVKWSMEMNFDNLIDGNPLSESNLCVRHIGSAGVVELETIRFFKRRSIDINLGDIGRRYPQIFYWLL